MIGMALHPLAGQPAPPEFLVDVEKLVEAYFANAPDMSDPQQRVSFGTSGHRGTSLAATFTEAHILAIAQAICDYRRERGYAGTLFMGKDTHALSAPAERTAIEVFAANGVNVAVEQSGGYTPTPVISHAILGANRGGGAVCDGVVITPSHNPPADGGFKYNPPDGGPAGSDVTSWIERRANELLLGGNRGVRRVSHDEAMRSGFVRGIDFAQAYIEELDAVIDMEAVRSAGLRIGVDPLGGAAVHYWARIAERYGLNLTVVNPRVDPAFSFMTLDHDGKIRMDCSSPYAMAGLVGLAKMHVQQPYLAFLQQAQRLCPDGLGRRGNGLVVVAGSGPGGGIDRTDPGTVQSLPGAHRHQGRGQAGVLRPGKEAVHAHGTVVPVGGHTAELGVRSGPQSGVARHGERGQFGPGRQVRTTFP